jgi:hypothetical protein
MSKKTKDIIVSVLEWTVEILGMALAALAIFRKKR